MESILSQCIDSCEKSIDAAQKFIDMCAVSNDTECAKSTGIVIGRLAQCADDCKEAIKHCRKAMEKMSNGNQRKIIEWAITKASDCINNAQKTIDACKDSSPEASDHCVAFIKAAEECSEACNNAMDELY